MPKASIVFKSSVAEKVLAKWRGRIEDARPILTTVYAIYGIKDIDKHFRREEGPGGRWQRRSKSTQRRYEQIRSGKRNPPVGVARGAFNPSNKVLQLTGTLRSSILPGNVRRLGANSILVFSNDPKSKRLDQGATEDRLPARPFMWLSDASKNQMANAVARLILK